MPIQIDIGSTVNNLTDDCVVIVKNGKVTAIEKHPFGEVITKFHAKEIVQVDSTKKSKY